MLLAEVLSISAEKGKHEVEDEDLEVDESNSHNHVVLDMVLDVDVEDLGAPGNNMPFLRCDELNTD